MPVQPTSINITLDISNVQMCNFCCINSFFGPNPDDLCPIREDGEDVFVRKNTALELKRNHQNQRTLAPIDIRGKSDEEIKQIYRDTVKFYYEALIECNSHDITALALAISEIDLPELFSKGKPLKTDHIAAIDLAIGEVRALGEPLTRLLDKFADAKLDLEEEEGVDTLRKKEISVLLNQLVDIDLTSDEEELKALKERQIALLVDKVAEINLSSQNSKKGKKRVKSLSEREIAILSKEQEKELRERQIKALNLKKRERDALLNSSCFTKPKHLLQLVEKIQNLETTMQIDNNDQTPILREEYEKLKKALPRINPCSPRSLTSSAKKG